MTDFELMGAALDEARKAAALGEVPVAWWPARADGGGPSSHPRRKAANALHHAELLAIDAACKALGGWRLWSVAVRRGAPPPCAGAILEQPCIRRVCMARPMPRPGAAAV